MGKSQFDEQTLRRMRVLLSLQSALIGEITLHLRAVKVGYDMKHIDLYFIYDGEISENDKRASRDASERVLADFPDDEYVKSHHIRCDYPSQIPDLGDDVAYRRNEVMNDFSK
jgi:hypothetical protein